MRIEMEPGKYVLAVSGGMDSMVLLDLLAKRPDIELVVAHFNHGIRPDSDKDQELAASRARQLGERFTVGYGHLGASASEAAARQARYKFLESVRKKYQADAIITAHHQDDLIETAILNILRGTGHRGMVSISSNKHVIRPLLNYGKKDILDYAKRHGLEWQEDISNQDDAYLRNYVRRHWLSKTTVADRRKFISNIDNIAKIEPILIKYIATISQYVDNGAGINRQRFTRLPTAIGNELVAEWLRKLPVADADSRTINRLNIALRTAKADTEHRVKQGWRLRVERTSARFVHSL